MMSLYRIDYLVYKSSNPGNQVACYREQPKQRGDHDRAAKHRPEPKENTAEEIKFVDSETIAIEIVEEVFEHRFASSFLVIVTYISLQFLPESHFYHTTTLLPTFQCCMNRAK